MSGDAGERGDRGAEPPDEAALSARLKSLGQRLDQANSGSSRGADTSFASRSAADHSAFARGFRLSSELVAGVLVGAALGWLIDRWLGSSPWGVIVGALLGFFGGLVHLVVLSQPQPGEDRPDEEIKT